MKPTLLLLSLVAIALISGTEANTKHCSNCRGNHKIAGSFRGMWGKDEDEIDDGDMDDEDECSTRNFDRVLVATTEMTGVAPNEFCARAVFDQICDQCEDNLQCYFKLGRQVGPKTPQCQPRRLGRCSQCSRYFHRNHGSSPFCQTFCGWRL